MLTHALHFPHGFKIEWIKIVLSHIHDIKIWLVNGPIRIRKSNMHRVSGYPTLDRPKSMQIDGKEVIEKKIGSM